MAAGVSGPSRRRFRRGRGKPAFTIAVAKPRAAAACVESLRPEQGSLHGRGGILLAGASLAEAAVVSLLDRAPAADPGGSAAVMRTALRSLSSATLTVGSAATFLVLVTALSFVPDRGTADVAAGGAPEGSFAWQLRGSLPSDDASPRERPARTTASQFPPPGPFAAVASRS